jgi:hypothetical protein
MISWHYPCATVDHGAEHVVSLIVEKLMVLPSLHEYGKLFKVVSDILYNDRSAMVVIIFLSIWLSGL